MEEIVHQLADLCSLRDRNALNDALVQLLFLQGKGVVRAVRLLRVVGDPAEPRSLLCAEFDVRKMTPVHHLAWKDWRELPAMADYPARMQARMQTRSVEVRGQDGNLVVVGVGESRPAATLLEFELAAPLPPARLRVLEGIARIYASLESLLDYGEKDSLTELLNRKTFDGAFQKAAMEMAATPEVLDRDDRRAIHTQDGFWLAVMDIDFFKRVNDRFGHLIGDEVLLLMARLMRTGFRTHDQLYRFGGEEFVVLMRCASAEAASRVLERFRHVVEDHAFPQIGSITVSIGYTALHNDDTPGGAFDRADKAVYHAKVHGRNQVVSYQALVDAGELTEETGTSGEVDFF